MKYSANNKFNSYSFEGPFYREPGTAESLICKLEEMEGDGGITSTIANAELCYLRGNMFEAEQFLKNAEKLCKGIFQAEIGTYMLKGVCAMYRGELRIWIDTREKLHSIRCNDKREHDMLQFWEGAYDSTIYEQATWPEWFCKGRIEIIQPSEQCMAQVFYVKYLLNKAMDSIREGKIRIKGLKEQIVSFNELCEPLIASISHDGAVVSEIRMRLLCATGYHMLGEDIDAEYHLDKAVALAFPDQLFAPLAEYRLLLDYLLDDSLKSQNYEAYTKVKELSEILHNGWTEIHNNVLDRSHNTDLSMREREVARLAAFGYTNESISKRLNISINTIRTHLKSIFQKTGASKRDDLKKHL